MRVKSIRIENYKAVKEFEGVVEGHSFFLIGGNNAGKSTVAQAVFDLITAKFPDTPIRRDEKKATIEVTLDTGNVLKAVLHERSNGPVLLVDGIPATARSFKELVGTASGFDINEFMAASPKARTEIVERLISGLGDVTHEYKQAYEERRKAKQYAAMLAAQIQPFSPEDATADFIDTKAIEDQILALQQKLNAAVHRNRDIEKAREMAQRSNDYLAAEGKVNELETRIVRINADKRKAIDEAGLPFGIDEAGNFILPDGTPLEDTSISTSTKMMLAFDLACRGMNRLRYYHFDASILDNRTLDALFQLAEERDVQLAVERVSYEATDDTIELIVT
jgi:DNA repair exonuclease SbcCD ATPase subunit